MLVDVILPVYVIGVAFAWVVAIIYVQSTSTPQKTFGARMVFLAPIWFVPAAVALYDGIRWLWKQADWNNTL